MVSKSFVHFKDGSVFGASNDGMEILGHFLLTQVGAKANFFIKWLQEKVQGEISSGSYFLEKTDAALVLSHLNNERINDFQTTKKSFIEILKQWESRCKSDTNSACKVGGADFIIYRMQDGNFAFDTKVK